jgi:hypothetical protein
MDGAVWVAGGRLPVVGELAPTAGGADRQGRPGGRVPGPAARWWQWSSTPRGSCAAKSRVRRRPVSVSSRTRRGGSHPPVGAT